jgi:hypothetical protein
MQTNDWLDAANYWQSALGGVFVRLAGKPLKISLRSGAQFDVIRLAPMPNISGDLGERRKGTFALMEVVLKDGQKGVVVCPYHELSHVVVPGQYDDLLGTEE